MKTIATAPRLRRDPSPRHYALAVRTALGTSGAMISLAGIALLAGGLVSRSDSSAFYAFTGAGLIISGFLISRRNRAGAWSYAAVFAATVTWSLRNVDYGSSLTIRLLGPGILLANLALLMPMLFKWRPRRTAIIFCAVLLGTVALGVSSTRTGPLARHTAALTDFVDSHAKGVVQ